MLACLPEASSLIDEQNDARRRLFDSIGYLKARADATEEQMTSSLQSLKDTLKMRTDALANSQGEFLAQSEKLERAEAKLDRTGASASLALLPDSDLCCTPHREARG